jgi:hypothetical protein
MKFTKLLMTMLPTVEPWVVPGENVDNPGGVPNVNPLDTLSSDLHPWGGRVRPRPIVSLASSWLAYSLSSSAFLATRNHTVLLFCATRLCCCAMW